MEDNILLDTILILSDAIIVLGNIRRSVGPMGNYFSIILTKHGRLSMTSFNHSPATGLENNEAISCDVMVIALFNIRYINEQIIWMVHGSYGIFGKFGCQMSRDCQWGLVSSIERQYTIYSDGKNSLCSNAKLNFFQYSFLFL